MIDKPITIPHARNVIGRGGLNAQNDCRCHSNNKTKTDRKVA